MEGCLDRCMTPETGDVAVAMKALLNDSNVGEESATVQVLKCIHQEIIHPAVVALRDSIYAALPYKDIRGEWRVRVDIGAEQIQVCHQKWEQTHRDEDPLRFHKFRWSLVLSARHSSLYHGSAGQERARVKIP